MDSLLAIGVGLVLRIVVDFTTDNDDKVGGVLVGLWEGVVLNHFVRRMPHSFDPYLGFGFRIFVDFLFTQSVSRLALVALWSLVGMLLADVAPNVWRDSGLRHLYRQVYKDVRRVKRFVPRIRIKNDLPSVRLFSRTRSTSSEVSGSIRSDRAVPSRSAAPSPVPAPGPSRRPGRSPPGTLPDVSGWSETNTDVSNPRTRVITDPGPSPALIPSREHEAYEHIDATHASTITITQTQSKSILLETTVGATALDTTAAATSVEPIDDPSRHDPPVIPDDWVDVDHPTPAQLNEPAVPQPDSDLPSQPRDGPSSLTQSRPASIFVPTPPIDILPDIPDTEVSKISQPPEDIPLPESRAASVIGGMYGQPEPRSAFRARVGKATSEIGVDPTKSLAPVTETQTSKVPEDIPLPESRAASVIGGIYDQPEPRSTLRDSVRARVGKATSELGVDSAKSLTPVIETQTSSSRGWSSWARSKLSQSVSVPAPEFPPKEARGVLLKPAKSDLGSTAPGPEPQVCTPAQVDPPLSILTQPGDAPPMLFASETEPIQQQQEQPPPLKSEPEQPPASAGVDQSPAPPPQGEAENGDEAVPGNSSLLDLPARTRTPPPPYTGEGPAWKDPLTQDAGPAPTEPVGVSDSAAPGEGRAGEGPFTQDEAPAELTDEQKAIEEKRQAFLLTQVQELEGSRVDLQKKLDKEDDPEGSPANAIESDMEDAGKTLASIKARLEKQKFSDPPINPPIKEVILTDKSASEVQFAITNAILEELLARNDVGPITIQAFINKSKSLKLKSKATKDVVVAFAKRHKFTVRYEPTSPGIINITF